MTIEIVVGGRLGMSTLEPGYYYRVGAVDDRLFNHAFGPEVGPDSFIFDPERVVLAELRKRGCKPTVLPSRNAAPNTEWMRFHFLEKPGASSAQPFRQRYDVLAISPVSHEHRARMAKVRALQVFGVRNVPLTAIPETLTGLLAVGDELLRRTAEVRSRLPQPVIYVIVGRDVNLLNLPSEDNLYRRRNIEKAQVPDVVLEEIPLLPRPSEIRIVTYAPLHGDAGLLVELIASRAGVLTRQISLTDLDAFNVGDKVVFLTVPDTLTPVLAVTEVVDDLVVGHRLYGTDPVVIVRPHD